MTTSLLSKLCAGVISVYAVAGAALASQPDMQIETASGKVMVNSGHGFVVGNADVKLSVGDRVLVGKNSSLTISYLTAQCSVTYSEASVFVIPAKAPCKIGERLASIGTGFAAPVNFGAAAPVFTTFAGTSVSTTIGIGFGLTVFAAAAGTQFFPSVAPSLSAP